MNTGDYDDFVDEMWLGDPDNRIELARCGLGLSGEAGEVGELIKKSLRGDGLLDQQRVASELGDVLFYVTATAHQMGYNLDHIIAENVNKLRGRKARGTIKGSGENR